MGVERIAVLILLDKGVIPVVFETRKKLVADVAGLGSCRKQIVEGGAKAHGMEHKFGIVGEFEPDDLQNVPGCVRIRARLGSSARNRLANSSPIGSLAIELAELLTSARLVTCRPTGACNTTHIMPPGRIWRGSVVGVNGGILESSEGLVAPNRVIPAVLLV
jgi:hypothetical protein